LLPRGNVSITRQPQPGCLLFHQAMSRDHVIVTDLRKQKKPSFLLFKKKKIFKHKDTIRTETLQALLYIHVLSFSFCHYDTAEALPSTSV